MFDDLDREFDEMNRMIDRMFTRMRAVDWDSMPVNQPIYYGVSVDVGPDGVPHVQQFGNVHPEGQGAIESGVREPYVTSFVDDERHKLRVTAEMPGIEKSDVKVEALDDRLMIRAEGKDRRYEKALPLRIPVDTESAKATYNNGVLEITLDLKKPERPKGRDIQVE